MGEVGFEKPMKQDEVRLTVRAKVEIEEKANGKEAIIVNEIPYQVNKARLIEKIAELVRDKKIEGITDLT